MLSKDVLDGTRDQNFATQEKLIKEAGFEIPNLIDAVVSLLLHNLKTGEFVYSDGSKDHPCSFTRVQEQSIRGFRIAVGGFSDCGLTFTDAIFDSIYFGTSCSVKSIGT